MKQVLATLFIALLFMNVSAQEDEFSKMMRQMYQEAFVDIVNENMNLSNDQNVLFQPVFNDFQDELKIVMDKRLNTQKKFASFFDSMTDEQVKLIQSEVYDNRKSYNKLMKKYTTKLTKAIGPQSSFRFFLIVEKVKGTFDYSTIQNLPLVKN